MSAARRPLPAGIGAELVKARDARTPWKVLERFYKRRRTWLWTLWRAELVRQGRVVPDGEERCSVNIPRVASRGDAVERGPQLAGGRGQLPVDPILLVRGLEAAPVPAPGGRQEHTGVCNQGPAQHEQ